MNVMISCYALSRWAQFCSVVYMKLNSQRQYPGCKRFFLFFLIPDGLQFGLFAKKMQHNDVLFAIAHVFFFFCAHEVKLKTKTVHVDLFFAYDRMTDGSKAFKIHMLQSPQFTHGLKQYFKTIFSCLRRSFRGMSSKCFLTGKPKKHG